MVQNQFLNTESFIKIFFIQIKNLKKIITESMFENFGIEIIWRP